MAELVTRGLRARRPIAVAVVVVGLLLSVASALAANPKLSAKDYDRLGSARGTAFNDVGLVMQHGCDPDALPCIAKAIAREAAADDRVAAVAKGLLPKVAPGRCRTGVAATYTSWHKRALLVRQAGRAWAVSSYHAATQAYYYAKWQLTQANLVSVAC